VGEKEVTSSPLTSFPQVETQEGNMSEEFDLASILTPDSDFVAEQPAEIRDVVADFKTSAEEVQPVNESSPANDSNATESTPEFDYKAFEESVGGRDALEALAQLVGNPDTQLSDILPGETVQNLVWTALDNPETQAAVLSDPEVRATISREILSGHSIEDVQAILSQYEPGSGVNAEAYAQQSQAAEDRVQQFQNDFFVSPVDQTLTDMGIDQTRVEEISDALILAQGKFLQANNKEYLKVQSMVESGLVSQAKIAQARLANKWNATLIKQLEKLKVSAPVPKSEVTTNQSKVENKSYDISSNEWLSSFVNDFKTERIKRGL